MLKAIYLSGWEYNRILRPSPLEPVVSGLPVQVLWDGAAQFWLFETVYCTKEALDGDRAAYEEVGWTSGRIFEDLARRGFLTPIDWTKEAQNDSILASDLKESHAATRKHFAAADILDLLEKGEDNELEAIKMRLLFPLLLRLRCVKNVSPNSIRHWIRSVGSPSSARAISTAGDLLASALTESTGELRAGFRLCERPGTGLPPNVMQRQYEAEQLIQLPLIPALLAGNLPLREFHAQVASTREVYEPVNKQLWSNYVLNVDTLERLRDLARIHLWPQLHNEWLPKLDEDPTFLPKFQSLVSEALLRQQFDPYLKFVTDVGIITLGGVAGSVTGHFLGIDPLASGVGGAAASGIVRRGFDMIHESIRKKSDNLVLFLQKAKNVVAR